MKELLDLVPALGSSAASVFVVILFLRYMNAKDASQAEKDKLQTESVRAIGDSCHAHGMQMTEITTSTLADTTAAMQDNTRVLALVTDRLDRKP